MTANEVAARFGEDLVELNARIAITHAKYLFDSYSERGYHSHAEHAQMIVQSLEQLLEFYLNHKENK